MTATGSNVHGAGGKQEVVVGCSNDEGELGSVEDGGRNGLATGVRSATDDGQDAEVTAKRGAAWSSPQNFKEWLECGRPAVLGMCSYVCSQRGLPFCCSADSLW